MKNAVDLQTGRGFGSGRKHSLFGISIRENKLPWRHWFLFKTIVFELDSVKIAYNVSHVIEKRTFVLNLTTIKQLSYADSSLAFWDLSRTDVEWKLISYPSGC